MEVNSNGKLAAMHAVN